MTPLKNTRFSLIIRKEEKRLYTHIRLNCSNRRFFENPQIDWQLIMIMIALAEAASFQSIGRLFILKFDFEAGQL